MKLALTLETAETKKAKANLKHGDLIAPISDYGIGLEKLTGEQDLIATRKLTEEISTMLESQKIPLTHPSAKVAAVTSLVARFPPFESQKLDGKNYLRIK